MAQADVADAQLVERHRRHPHQAVGGLIAEVAGARIDAELVGVDEIEGDYRGAGIDHEAHRRPIDLGVDEVVAVRFRPDADGAAGRRCVRRGGRPGDPVTGAHSGDDLVLVGVCGDGNGADDGPLKSWRSAQPIIAPALGAAVSDGRTGARCRCA